MAGRVWHDRRYVSWSALGEGTPVVYLHGLIGSSLRTCAEVADAVDATSAQIIVPSRPGFGGSTRHEHRTLADAARDVEAVADELGLERFGVLGVSAGEPVALACAQELGDRVIATAVVSGAQPIDIPQTKTERRFARALRHERLSRTLAAPGVAALHATGAGIRSAHALLQDGRLAVGPHHGLRPETITSEVHLWHGAEDTIVPVERVLALSRRLPNAHTTVLLGEGHFFLRRHLTTVLGGLLEAGVQEQRYTALPAA